MNEIGRTIDGSVIVEISPEEKRAFERLHAACCGKSFDFRDFELSKPVMQMDLSHPLEMISSFALAKFRLTELENSIQMFRNALEKQGEQ